MTSPHRNKAMPEEIKHMPSQDVADSQRSGDRRLSSCSPSFEVPPTPRPSGAWDRSDYIHQTAKLESALLEIAKQHLADEMDDHTCEHANWQAGYEQCVKQARAALGLSENV
jgi:hypothetical protein